MTEDPTTRDAPPPAGPDAPPPAGPDAPPPAAKDAPPIAARYGLVRPVQGRYVAGVAAALGRATRTDPVLWRVLLAVLVCFAGVGALLYLLVWLLTPEEGDTASPIESLLGRGHSNTSPILAGVLGLVTVGLLAIILPRPFYLVLGGMVVTVLLLLINRSRTGAARPVGPPPADVPPPAPAPAGEVPTPPVAPARYDPPAPSDRPPPPASVPVREPAPTQVTDAVPPPAPPAGYRPPFAPHGPFVGPPPPPPPPPRPPRPPKERSALPSLTFFAALIALGILGVIHATGLLAVPVAGYVATALAVVGGGLLLGAWRGRARGLIALGIVLALALPAAHAADTWEAPEYLGDEFSWTPASAAELQDEYDLMFGAGRLDLRQIDMTGEEIDVAARVTFGEFRIIVPEDVAVEVTMDTQFAGATVFGIDTEGVTRDTFHDPGSGDPEDGTLRLDLQVRFGAMEVER